MEAMIFAGEPRGSRTELLPRVLAEWQNETIGAVIAADSGLLYARLYGFTPDLVVGDFDSLGSVPDNIKVIRVPAEKNETDTELALREAIRMGASRVFFVSPNGGRMDHALANLGLLEYSHIAGVDSILFDGLNTIRFISGPSKTVIKRGAFDYLSLIAVSETVTGVTLQGVKYPLENAVISRTETLCVSNEITGESAEVTIGGGSALIIESLDFL